MILLAKGLAPDIPWNTISSGMIDTEALKELSTEAVELLKAELPSNGVGKLWETAATVSFYAPTLPVLQQRKRCMSMGCVN